MSKKRVLIMGAAGRDFHNFNVYFRDRDEYEVVAFTATQIPDIEGRLYPPELSGKLYPEGIPIYPESDLVKLIKEEKIDQVIFAYSDVKHEYVMHKACIVIAAGADFRLMGPRSTLLKSNVPIISVCAVRTGVGKSQTTRKVLEVLEGAGLKAVAIRHPMPYGDLTKQVCQRFETLEDLKTQECTIEEIEEYEPHIAMGRVVYAGVDYGVILREAEKEADVIVWDGGNNDFPFYESDIHIVLADPLRLGHESTYFPGEANVRMADVVVINKVDTASPNAVESLEQNIRKLNPDALLIRAESPITVDRPDEVKGKKVLVIEDGPTLTHGEMPYGAGTLAAKRLGANELINPREYAVGSIKDIFKKFPHIRNLLPAMGYSEKQMDELRKTIERTPCELVVIGTPIDLRQYITIPKPAVRVTYDLKEIGDVDLEQVLKPIIEKTKKNL
ncbi:MAG: cyclic 2,3-diphosphoglycerate synthase [Candidatus Eremiobacteraeota bacterium]|nr:cyclic 2,3-diphosphoglycerate synthase [Candidatus Eremiobacteraeota bacterium]